MLTALLMLLGIITEEGLNPEPSTLIVSAILRLISPLLLFPTIELEIAAPLVTFKLLAVILISPISPAAPSSKKLEIPLKKLPAIPSKLISPVAVIIISPRLPSFPLKLKMRPPLLKLILRAFTLTFPAFPVPKLEFMITELLSITKSSVRLITTSPA